MHNTITPVPSTAPRGRVGRYEVVVAVIVAVAVVGIMWQQLVHTPWGLPGHRGIFWLSTLIAVRWAVDRPGAALGVAAASSGGILLVDPSMGVHVMTYLVAGFLVDLVAGVGLVRRHPVTMLVIAPAILMTNLINPFLRNLATAPLGEVLAGMGFYVQGHLVWGVAAGVVGVAAGTAGDRFLRPLRLL